MRKSGQLLIIASLVAGTGQLGGCFLVPGSATARTATVVYTSGARQHTAAVELAVAAEDVYAALIRIISENPDVEIVDRNDPALLIEITERKQRRITGQVTKLGTGNSLLYIWADAGSSGQTGHELAISAVEAICDELGVDYELVNY
jgi:hypothetical protein